VTAYHAYVRAASRFKETDAGQALRTSRWPVEPPRAWLVRDQGCRQACAVRNLLRWLNRTDRQRPHAEAQEQGGAGGRGRRPRSAWARPAARTSRRWRRHRAAAHGRAAATPARRQAI